MQRCGAAASCCMQVNGTMCCSQLGKKHKVLQVAGHGGQHPAWGAQAPIPTSTRTAAAPSVMAALPLAGSVFKAGHARVQPTIGPPTSVPMRMQLAGRLQPAPSCHTHCSRAHAANPGQRHRWEWYHCQCSAAVRGRPAQRACRTNHACLAATGEVATPRRTSSAARERQRSYVPPPLASRAGAVSASRQAWCATIHCVLQRGGQRRRRDVCRASWVVVRWVGPLYKGPKPIPANPRRLTGTARP